MMFKAIIPAILYENIQLCLAVGYISDNLDWYQASQNLKKLKMVNFP